MPRLADYSLERRPTPRFGNVKQAPEVVDSGKRELGAAIEGFGEMLIKEQIKADKYRVEDATTQLQRRILEETKGENGFIHKKAGDVANDPKFMDTRLAELKRAEGEIASGLGNEEQKRMFQRRAEALRLGFHENLINHVTEQKSVFNGQVYEGGVAAERDIVASDPYNVAEVKRALLRTDKLTQSEIDRLGLKGDAAKMALKENQSGIHETVIVQAVERGDYGYAKEWFDKNKKQILGDKHDDINKLLKQSGIKAETQAAVDDYVLEGLTEGEALKKAREDFKDKPEHRDAAVSRIKIRWGESAQQLDAEQKAAAEEAWSILNSGATVTEGFDAIPERLFEQMDGKEARALKDYAEQTASGKPIKTNYGTYYQLKNLMTEDPVKFKDQSQTNLMAYRHLLGDTELKELINLQTNEQEFETARTKNQILKEGAASIGFDPNAAAKDTTEGEKVRAFNERVEAELKSLQESTGKKPTNQQISEVVDRATIKVIRERTINPLSDVPFGFGDAEEAAGMTEIEGVPTGMIDELAYELRLRGVEPITGQAIKEEYDRLRNQQLFIMNPNKSSLNDMGTFSNRSAQ